jgi:hypothetical protein
MADVMTRTGAMEAQHGGRTLAVAGLAVGVLGGAAMALFMVFAAAVNGLEPLAPLEAMGETFTDQDAPHGRPSFLVYGIFLHLAVASLVAILFLAMTPTEFTTTCAAVTGIGFTVLVMATMSMVVLPAANPELRAAMPALGGSWVIAHALYGVALGFGPGLRRRLRAA